MLLTVPRIGKQTTGRVAMKHERVGLLFLVAFSIVMVAPNFALADTSLDLYLGVAFASWLPYFLLSKASSYQYYCGERR